MSDDRYGQAPQNTSSDQQLEEKSLLGSSYSYQKNTIEVGPLVAKDLAETDDD